jgi:hypothetical protein
MFVTLLLARIRLPRPYAWQPSIHVEDAVVRSALIPFGMS